MEKLLDTIFKELPARVKTKWYIEYNNKIFINDTAVSTYKYLYNSRGAARRQLINQIVSHISRYNNREQYSNFIIMSKSVSGYVDYTKTAKLIGDYVDTLESEGKIAYKTVMS